MRATGRTVVLVQRARGVGDRGLAPDGRTTRRPSQYNRASLGARGSIRRGARHNGASGLREPCAPYDVEARADGNDPLAALNPREREVLALVAQGLSNAEIGAALGMTANGANHHLKSIFRKFGVHKRTQAAAIYFEAYRRTA